MKHQNSTGRSWASLTKRAFVSHKPGEMDQLLRASAALAGTWVWLPGPHGASQSSGIVVPEDSTPPSGLLGPCIHVVHGHMCT